MKLEYASKYNKKTIAVFVKKTECKKHDLSSSESEHEKIFKCLLNDKNYTTCMPYAIAENDGKRILFVTYSEVKSYENETWKMAGHNLLKAMKDNHIKNIDVDLSSLAPETYSSLCLGMLLSSYSFTKYFGEKKLSCLHIIDSITLVSSDKKNTETAIKSAQNVYQHVAWARDMINEPSNAVYPETFVSIAKKECKSRNIKVTTIDMKQMKTLGLNGILAVNAGSKNPPAMFIGEYKNPKAKKTIVLVGKGVTFDSGGMSLKPADSMVTMKDDMGGAAAVCGALFLLADKQVNANIIAIAPLTDNKTGSGAQNPGDIIKMYNGTTVEVLNTDAEGRIILGDALAYGVKKYKPDYIIDIATLTGACPVALGKHASGLMGNDKKLIEAIKEAGDATYERVWELPMFSEYKDQLKSQVGDIVNTGGRGAGTIVAGFFLSNFIDETKWAHIDIAGTAFLDAPHNYLPQGATGVGVRLLTKMVKNLIK